MITATTARRTAEEYLSVSRPWARLAELLEDAEDYFVLEELVRDQPWPLGPGAIFISKADGELRTEPWGAVIDRVDAMTPVEQPSAS